MNANRIRTLITAIIFGYLIMPLSGYTHESVDTLHATPVETVDSSLASPTGIHVQVTDKSVEVTGILKRHINIRTKGLRGHVDVELLDADGQVLETVSLPIRHRPGSPRHDHEREFSATLPVPSSGGFTVRVRHNIGSHDH